MLLNNEDLLTLPEAARRTKRNGRSLAPSTLYRWAHAGIKGIKLEVIMAGGTSCTSMAAIERFFARCTAQKAGGPDPIPEYQARQADVQARLAKHFNRKTA